MTETFFNLTWLIPLLPLTAFVLIVLVTNRNRLLSTWLAWLGIGLAWILGWLVFFGARGAAHELTPPRGGRTGRAGAASIPRPCPAPASSPSWTTSQPSSTTSRS